MPRRFRTITFTAVGAALLAITGLIYADRTMFIHVFGYTGVAEHEGLSVSVELRPGTPIRDETPERMVGPPYSVILKTSCQPTVQSHSLVQVLAVRSNGTKDNCRILVRGKQLGSFTLADATLKDGRWGQHVSIIAVFELNENNKQRRSSVEIPLSKSHKRKLKLPMI